jgi:3-deoxy-D-manno-octulosonic-acid transferase
LWLAYRLLTALLAPVWLAYLAVRQWGGARLKQRLGLLEPRADGPVWIQAVSVGEVKIALRLAGALSRLGFPVVLTSTTAAGIAVASKEGPPALSPQAFPLDLPSCMRRALRRLKPRAVVLVETELWPALLKEARDAGVPAFVVNARLSDRSLKRTLRFKRLFARALKSARVSAQSEEHAARFRMLGAVPEHVVIQGNLKYDLMPPPDFERVRGELASQLPEGPVWVAGSVRDGEEDAACEALTVVRRSFPDARLILAPRHLHRTHACVDAARDRGFWVRCRSDGGGRDWDVLVLDRIGELWSAYDLGAAAFVGGSLVPFGGQNVLEPAFLAKPVLFGPSTENFREEAERLVAVGGGFRVASAPELGEMVSALLSDPERAASCGKKAREAVLRHSGAVSRAARWIAEYVPGV